jgi:hypothetical protein
MRKQMTCPNEIVDVTASHDVASRLMYQLKMGSCCSHLHVSIEQGVGISGCAVVKTRLFINSVSIIVP